MGEVILWLPYQFTLSVLISMLSAQIQRRKLMELKAAQPETKAHTTTAIQIERAIQERQQTVQDSPSLPQMQLKRVEKPTPVEPELQEPVDVKPVQKVPKSAPKPKHPIAQPPQFTKPLAPVKVVEGKSATLEVEFEGFPPPHISWYRESFEIRPSNDFQVEYLVKQ